MTIVITPKEKTAIDDALTKALISIGNEIELFKNKRASGAREADIKRRLIANAEKEQKELIELRLKIRG